MNNFFKVFFAALLALFIFSVLSFFIFFGFISVLATPEKEQTGAKAVLVVDLSQTFPEVAVENPLAAFGDEKYETPSIYNVVRLIHKAKGDSAVKGIFIKCGENNNGFGNSDEIRNALIDFKTSKKFIYAYADVIPQRAYHVANVADKIYCNPQGGVDWSGFAMHLAFLKGTLEKLNIEPQIFYAGKFKSATEPFRERKMTDANRLQNNELLHDLYKYFITETARQRKLDTASLKRYADQHLIKFASDAVKYGLVDGAKYDDEVKDEIKQKLKVERLEKINFVQLGKYAKAVNYKQTGKEKIAVIYAAGTIVDGKGERDEIGSETYRNLIRKARLDESIKAIVIRVNSGGGSAMASENIWRELSLARKNKPVIVSFGDVSASGGYYISCNADSVFAQPNTITGSIGVFSLIPNMQNFFNNKLGITFDGVKTSPEAGGLTIIKPLSAVQKQYMQTQVDTIYHHFKSRVAEGRKMQIEYVDSIGQGRVWSGTTAVELGLIDKIGGLQDAIDCAARLAKLKDYKLREYPEPPTIFDVFFGNFNSDAHNKVIKEELGEEGVKTYNTIKKLKQMLGTTQARLPFDFSIE